MNLKNLGWNDFFETAFSEYNNIGLCPGRVSAVFQNCSRVITEHGEIEGRLTGKMIQNKEYPAVGDWCAVAVDPINRLGAIHAVLSRKSKFSRKIAGNRSDEQIISANIDTVFIVMSLNDDFNIRRLERYLTIVWNSGATPVIILSKADLCSDIPERVSQVEDIAFGVNIHVISSLTKEGLDTLRQYMTTGTTITLTGSSGVGKSTLLNTLTGRNIMRVNSIREDDSKGRHTTTHRELFVLNDAIIIDNPGMREIQLLDTTDALDNTFEDISELGKFCKFSDCQHETEPGCAVRAAIENGELSQERFESYKKLQKEVRYMESRVSLKSNQLEKAKWKSISKLQKNFKK